MQRTGKKNAPTFSFCVIKYVDFWFCHVNMKEKVRKRPCIPQEASQTAHFDPPGSLALHGRGGSVSRRDHNQAAETRAQLAGARKYAGRVKPIPRRSSGGSAREGLLSEKPPPLQHPHRPLRYAGRGGSVSRRDHNQAAGTRAQHTGARKLGGRVKPIPRRSSGGSAREGLLSEKPPPSQHPHRPLH